MALIVERDPSNEVPIQRAIKRLHHVVSTGLGIPFLQKGIPRLCRLRIAKAFIHRVLGGKCKECGTRSLDLWWHDKKDASMETFPEECKGRMNLHHPYGGIGASGDYVTMTDVINLLVADLRATIDSNILEL